MLSLVRRCKLQDRRTAIRAINRSIVLQQRSMSFKVRIGATQAPEVPIAKQQRVQQTWTISGTESLEKLRVASPGLTYVSVAPAAFFEEVAQARGCSADQLVAVARVSSDAIDLLERAEILARGSNRLLIGFSPRPPQGWPVAKPSESGKYLLTELFVREDSELRNIGAFGGGDLVLAGTEELGSVLESDRPYGNIKLAAVRGSRLFVLEQHEKRQGGVDLLATQGGHVSLSTPALLTKQRIRVAASGRWNGSNVAVQTDKLLTPSLRAAMVGSGNVRFVSTSEEVTNWCESQSLAIAGSGIIDTGDLASRSARVGVLGPGVVTLQASESLTVGSLGGAKVNYLEPEPKHVWGSSKSLRALTEDQKSQRKRQHEAIAAAAPPNPESAFESTIDAMHWWWWAPWSAYHPHGFHRREMRHYKRWHSDENSY